MAKKKPDANSNRAQRAKKASEGAEAKRKYIEDKGALMESEKDNYTRLMVIPTPSGWWKMFGHSALIYKYYIAERLKIKVRLMNDSDYDYTSEDGCVSIPSLDDLKKKLKTLHIYPVKENERGCVFELNDRITEQDLQLWRQERAALEEKVNQLITPKEHTTELNTKVRELYKIVSECVRKLDGVTRETFAGEMCRRMARLQVMVIRAARGSADLKATLAEAKDVSEELYGYATIMMNLRLLETKKILELTHAVVALGRTVDKEVQKHAMREAEEELNAKIKDKR